MYCTTKSTCPTSIPKLQRARADNRFKLPRFKLVLDRDAFLFRDGAMMHRDVFSAQQRQLIPQNLGDCAAVNKDKRRLVAVDEFKYAPDP